jgi:hypothetical protein
MTLMTASFAKATAASRSRRIQPRMTRMDTDKPGAKSSVRSALFVALVHHHISTRIFHTCCRIRGWDRRPACPGRRLADRNVKQHPAIKRVFSTLIVLRIPPGQWPGGTGGSPVPPRRCEIYGSSPVGAAYSSFRGARVPTSRDGAGHPVKTVPMDVFAMA